jgi:uncharacterized protein (TIGR02266 family)
MSDESPKVAPRAEIALKVEYANIDAFLDDYAVNISRGGAMIRVGPEVVVGDRVDLALTFPGLLAPIRVHGVVRWVEAGPDGDQHAGVELEGQGPVPLEATIQRIRALDPALVTPIVRVAVVEDNAHVAKLLTDGLDAYRKRSNAPLAFVTQYAANGKDALAMLKERPCDVLLVDMYLPILDGEGLIRTLRADEKTRQLPIVALSAGGREARDTAVAAGADFFLDKPVRLSEVLGVLQKILTPRTLPKG